MKAVWALLVALLVAPASCLQLTAFSGARVTRSSSAPSMALPSIADAKNLSDDEIVAEIFSAQKELFELRKKVKTRQEVKPHLFTHTKQSPLPEMRPPNDQSNEAWRFVEKMERHLKAWQQFMR